MMYDEMYMTDDYDVEWSMMINGVDRDKRWMMNDDRWKENENDDERIDDKWWLL